MRYPVGTGDRFLGCFPHVKIHNATQHSRIHIRRNSLDHLDPAQHARRDHAQVHTTISQQTCRAGSLVRVTGNDAVLEFTLLESSTPSMVI